MTATSLRITAWKSQSQVAKLQQQLLNFGKAPQSPQPTALKSASTREIDQILQDLDSSGRWITTANGDRLVGQAKMKPGEQFISSAAFSENLTKLCQYLMHR